MYKNLVKRAVAVVTLAAACFMPALGADTYPKRELRGVWVASLGIDWPAVASSKGVTTTAETNAKAEARKYLDKLKAAGINAVFFHVRPMADRVYLKTQYPETGTAKFKVEEPFSSYVSGTRGKQPTYDPLQFWIEECHARGMELHAWFNPYRFYNTSSDKGANYNPYSTTEDKATVDNGLIIHAGSGTTWKYIFNPALPETNTRIISVLSVLTGCYDIDGILCDDYFYPEGLALDSTAEDWAQYQAYKNGGGTLGVADWRRSNINNMMKKAYAAVKAIKPWVRFGAAPAGVATQGVKTSDGIPPITNYCNASDWQYAGICSDPIAWLRDKSIDYLSPQLYWTNTHKTCPYNKLAQWYGVVAEKLGRPVMPSHSISIIAATAANASDTDPQKFGNNAYMWAELAQHIKDTRDANRDGSVGLVTYSACNIDGSKNEGLGNVYKEKYYQHPAASPAMPWIEATDLGAVKGLKRNGDRLEWTSLGHTKYIAYAIPNAVKPEDARSDEGGFRAEYIIDISYTNSIAIPAAERTGYWYAVSALDYAGNEWEAATLGAPTVTPPTFTPYTEPGTYSQHSVQLDDNRTLKIGIQNIWMRNQAHNPWTETSIDGTLGLSGELCRDMCLRAADNIVYIASRTAASASAPSALKRVSGTDGQSMDDLALTYDADYNTGTYPANGVLTDDAGNLLVHNLSVANTYLSLAKVDPATGKCTTLVKVKSGYRTDHCDVWGNVASGTWYLFAPSTISTAVPTKVVRYTIQNGTVTKTEEMDCERYVGAAPRIHALSATEFYIDGSTTGPVKYTFGNSTPVATLPDATVSGNGVTTFNIEGQTFAAYIKESFDGANGGYRWAVTTEGGTSPTQLWTIPNTGLGSYKQVSADWGGIASMGGDKLAVYSPGNGIAAYRITRDVTTSAPVIETQDNAPAEYLTLQGVRVEQPLQPGLYLERRAGRTAKVLVR